MFTNNIVCTGSPIVSYSVICSYKYKIYSSVSDKDFTEINKKFSFIIILKPYKSC